MAQRTAHSYAVNGKYFDDVLKKLSSEKIAMIKYIKEIQNEIGESLISQANVFLYKN